MKRILSKFSIIAAACILALSCNKDDDAGIAPPRDYGVQYATERADIEKYLDDHYIEVDANMNVTIDSLDTEHTISIRNQTAYQLLSKEVVFSGITYKVYYLVLNEGIGDAPTRGDNILAAYKGQLLNGTQFDSNPFPQSPASLNDAILGWQEIVPLFKEGVYIPNPPTDPNGPAQFENYGAGVMILPSALAYYDRSLDTAPAYSTMIFSFKLYRVDDTDIDGDGIVNRDEMGGFDDVSKFDSDGDGIPNYRDTDDDNDGVLTRDEITNPVTNQLYSPYSAIPSCNPLTEPNGTKRHLDPSCF